MPSSGALPHPIYVCLYSLSMYVWKMLRSDPSSRAEAISGLYERTNPEHPSEESLLIANPVSSPPSGMFVRELHTYI